MRPNDAHPALRSMLVTLRIILGVSILGLAAILGVGAWMHLGPVAHARPTDASYLTWVCVALGLTQPVVFGVTRMVLTRHAIELWSREDPGPFRGKYMAAVIVGAAGIEAAGLFAGAMYLLEGRIAALGAGGLCVLVLVLSIPTRRGVDHLIGSRP